MEWQGIDLAGNAQSKWIFTTYYLIKKMALVLFSLIGIALFLIFYHLQKKQEIYPLVEQLNQLQTENRALENKIANLQSHNQVSLPVSTKKEIEKFITLIMQLPLKKGGINTIQLYHDNRLYLKISGKISSQEDFQALDKYLKEQQVFELKTDHISVNNKNETEFIFTLKYQG
ncbi:hypothetical protein A6B39_01905 [Mannheimia granulomatis]|uniref:hypothetical protein n=1 Tax=Mannheimia granulomatis TaxID=85402 RepID=UPI00159E8BA6|nr:hypothetical protein [Mannheimia granulomatis]QLB14288.1 hypothetical protein A6B39_01905 [Mannheimia granulomatis]